MDRAEAQKALQACIADEQTYQFTSFSHRDAWELGHALVDACEKMGAPLAVEIEINHVIDYAACSGAFPIRIRGGSVIGVAAVSGLPDPGDQTALLNGLRAYFEAHS